MINHLHQMGKEKFKKERETKTNFITLLYIFYVEITKNNNYRKKNLIELKCFSLSTQATNSTKLYGLGPGLPSLVRNLLLH